MKATLAFAALLSLLVLAACASPATPPPAPTAVAVSTVPVLPTDAPLSFTPATYTDEANGFDLRYPSDWSVVPNKVIGSRGSEAQLLSPGTTAEQLGLGGTRLTIAIYAWDPKNDLAAFVAQRRSAWEASMFTVTEGSHDQVHDGRQAMDFVIQSPAGEQSYFLFTILGDRYLQLAGEGDLELLSEMAHTLRVVGPQP